MADRRNETKDEQPMSEGKLAWVHPAVQAFPAREAETNFTVSGSTDLGVYHS